jgi:hypothetical protein
MKKHITGYDMAFFQMTSGYAIWYSSYVSNSLFFVLSRPTFYQSIPY